jgi:integrase
VPPEASGNVVVKTLSDGTLVFRLRFRVHGQREIEVLHERRDCKCGCGGGWNERTAKVELENILAKVRAGVWKKRKLPERVEAPPMPTFHEYASKWLENKKIGLLGDRPIGTNTQADYRSRLANHILPFFGEYRVSEITTDDCLEFKAHKLKESAELQRSLEAGAELRDRRGRRVRPLGPATLRKLIACLTSILDEAVSDGYLSRNPARTRRMRIKVPKPRRTFLEMDELVALIGAAAKQDASVARARLPVTPKPGTTAAKVAERWASGMRAIHIAADLGISRPTVTYHLRRMHYEDPGVYEGRRAIVATLGGSGVRVSELCNIRIRDLRLHAASGAHLRIPDGKTEAGVREVQVSPDLLEEIVAHVDALRRVGLPIDGDAYLFCNRRGGRLQRQKINKIVGEAAALASTDVVARGLPQLPNTTPHTLRRTYISIALLANRFDVLSVMRQVGHADSKMTMDVYAQLQQRAERSHGEAFDALVRTARERLYGAVERADDDGEEAAPSRERTLEDLVDEWRDEPNGD